MRKKINIPRIIKIDKIEGLKIYCMFNNGEIRLINFEQVFKEWNIKPTDLEFPITEPKEFKKVKLRNNTLSWDNIQVTLLNENEEEERHPYELSPDVIYSYSLPVNIDKTEGFGRLIKKARINAGLTQEQLAMRSGTTRFYISRLENNRTDVELSTFRKIIEAGLGKKFKLVIE